MDATGTKQAKAGIQVKHTVLQPNYDFQHAHNLANNLAAQDRSTARRVGYGLPCSNCGTYYGADQSVCPICRCAERVSPAAVLAPPTVKAAESLPEPDELEVERERFLREFKSQLFAAHTQINTAASFGCSLEDHEAGYEPASVCKSCYDRVQERADQMEAALLMDLKEAAQIVYDAVWSDPSDPRQTYQNAAQALLTELRMRAGISIILTTLQPYTH